MLATHYDKTLLNKLSKISLMEMPGKFIQSIPTQDIYTSVQIKGPEDSLEILQHISKEQFLRICDYDVWHKDRLLPPKLFQWLQLYKQISPEQMYTRFRALDEEYQLACLQPYLKVFTEDQYESLDLAYQDQLYSLPAGGLYYSIDTEDQRLRQDIEDLISISIQQDMEYAITIISTAAQLPPNEQEFLLSQFRQSRLEEDGFVSYVESLELFRPVEVNLDFSASTALKKNSLNFWQDIVHLGNKTWTKEQLNQIKKGFAYLTNSLCSSIHVETYDVKGLHFIMVHCQSIVSLGLEHLSQADPYQGVKVLQEQSVKYLFRVGLGLINDLRKEIILKIQNKNPENKLFNCLNQDNYINLFNLIDEKLGELDIQDAEIIKGLFNKLPVAPDLNPDTQTHNKVPGIDIKFSPISSITQLQNLKENISQILNRIEL